jgi:hypothetical protein
LLSLPFINANKPLGIRSHINSAFFDPSHESHASNSIQQRKAQDCRDRIYKFYKEPIAKTRKPASNRKVGKYIKNDSELGQHYHNCDICALGKKFIASLPAQNRCKE